MSDRGRTWTALGIVSLSLVAIVISLTGDPGTPTDRVHALATRLKCPVCESESIADSPAQIARDSYDLIAEKVADGWTDQEVLDFFVDAYGDVILLDPETNGFGHLLWIAPVAALAIGVVVIAGRKVAKPPQITSEQRRRLERELQDRS